MPLGDRVTAQITGVNPDGTFNIRLLQSGQTIKGVTRDKITSARSPETTDRWYMSNGAYVHYNPKGFS